MHREKIFMPRESHASHEDIHIMQENIHESQKIMHRELILIPREKSCSRKIFMPHEKIKLMSYICNGNSMYSSFDVKINKS